MVLSFKLLLIIEEYSAGKTKIFNIISQGKPKFVEMLFNFSFSQNLS